MKRKAGKTRQKWTVRVYSSFAELDESDRQYWWNKTPYERLRACEELRQLNYGYGRYGKGKPPLRFQRVVKVSKLGEG